MANRLAQESSPYLLQHRDNPVDWYPWGAEALRRARELDRPLLVSIGYSACHWCHVMAHESFDDPEAAAVMNEHFVNVKVDREERPDVDALYMDAVVAMTGSGGWPMTVFLRPTGEPFSGGTYFPPTPRHGMPAFRDVLLGIAKAWREDREKIEEISGNLVAHLRTLAPKAPEDGGLGEEIASAAIESLYMSFDFEWGRWGRAPKFPPAATLEFLLRRDERAMTEKTLDAMALGGMYDLVGGGFHRYSVDQRWLVQIGRA